MCIYIYIYTYIELCKHKYMSIRDHIADTCTHEYAYSVHAHNHQTHDSKSQGQEEVTKDH